LFLIPCSSRRHRDVPSFPTRRSSDLSATRATATSSRAGSGTSSFGGRARRSRSPTSASSVEEPSSPRPSTASTSTTGASRTRASWRWRISVTTTGRVRIAAVADLHCRLGRRDNFRRLVKAVNEQSADISLMGGDLTDHGHPDEARLLADSLSEMVPPIVGVLGNHDLDCGKKEEVVEILGSAGITILD